MNEEIDPEAAADDDSHRQAIDPSTLDEYRQRAELEAALQRQGIYVRPPIEWSY